MLNSSQSTTPTAFSILEGDRSVFDTDTDSVATIVLGLLCHPEQASGGTIVCRNLSPTKARLLLAYQPEIIQARAADPVAVRMLSEAGVEVRSEVIAEVEEPDEPDRAGIARIATAAGSPEDLRSKLTSSMLAALQQYGRVTDRWTSARHGEYVGNGGGGT
jgi:hypothetical protein